MSVADRFLAKVAIRSADECWEWLAGRSCGYGRFKVGGIAVNAHRFAYELLVGPIPEDLTLDHLCHNADANCPGGNACPHRRCVNPAHLEPVPNAENILRGASPSAQNARKTHCGHGHEFTSENTYRGPDGSRTCRTCLYDHIRNYKRRKRERRSAGR